MAVTLDLEVQLTRTEVGIGPPSVSTAKLLTSSTTVGRPNTEEAGVGRSVVNCEARDDVALLVMGWVGHKADKIISAASIVAD